MTEEVTLRSSCSGVCSVVLYTRPHERTRTAVLTALCGAVPNMNRLTATAKPSPKPYTPAGGQHSNHVGADAIPCMPRVQLHATSRRVAAALQVPPEYVRQYMSVEARSAALPHCDRPTGAQRHTHGNDGRRKVELPSAYTHALVWMTTSMSVMRVLRQRQCRPIRRPNSSGSGCAAVGAIATDAARARGCDATQRYGRTGGGRWGSAGRHQVNCISW